MAVTWDVDSLDVTKTVGSLSDVVTAVHWKASDADGDHIGQSSGMVGLAAADSGSFTAYADITKDNAITWAKDALGTDNITDIETGIAAQITESKTPIMYSGVPW